MNKPLTLNHSSPLTPTSESCKSRLMKSVLGVLLQTILTLMWENYAHVIVCMHN